MSLPRNPIKRFIKTRVGALLLALRPERARLLREGEVSADFSAIDRWMLAALALRAMRDGSFEALHGVHRHFWESDAGADHLLRADWRFRGMFLPHHAKIVAPMRAAAIEMNASRLVELGSGTGDVLNYLSEQLPEISEFIGIDLNQRLVAESRTRWPSKALHFECGDARVLGPGFLCPRSVLLTNGGVLEYFCVDQVQALYRHIAQAGSSVVALVESVHKDHDFARELNSRPYGSEMSYSHNYAHLLRTAGLQLRYQDEMIIGGNRWVLIVAVTPSR